MFRYLISRRREIEERGAFKGLTKSNYLPGRVVDTKTPQKVSREAKSMKETLQIYP